MSRFYIDADVVEVDGFVWRFTGFYGEPKTDRKEDSWRAMRALNAARRGHGYVLATLTRCCWGVRRKVVRQNLRFVWIGSGRPWRTVRLQILASWVTPSHGEIIVTIVIIIFGSAWIELLLMMIGVLVFLIFESSMGILTTLTTDP